MLSRKQHSLLRKVLKFLLSAFFIFVLVRIFIYFNFSVTFDDKFSQFVMSREVEHIPILNRNDSAEKIFRATMERVFGKTMDDVVDIKFSKPPARISTSYFTLQVVGNRLKINSDSVHSGLSAIHYYCFHYGRCTTSWNQRQLPTFPQKLPSLNSSKDSDAIELTQADSDANIVLVKQRYFSHVYYLNFCTPSYTMAWWSWKQWEKELDWMVLRGVNMPLIITGRELVMERLLLEFGANNFLVLLIIVTC